ncbi:MAG: adenylate/guanylate cyclase domain-containing protein [Candidatus Kapaibacteriota bacterium]
MQHYCVYRSHNSTTHLVRWHLVAIGITAIMLLTFGQSPCIAQSQGDSLFTTLRMELARSKHDTVRARVLLELGRLQRRSKPDEALHYAKEGVLLAEELHDDNLHTALLLLLATIAIDKSQYASAMQFALEARTKSENNSNDAAAAQALGIIGTIHRMQNNTTKAFEYAWKALAEAVRIGDKQQEAQALSNLGSTYRRLQNYDSARYYRLRSLVVYEGLNDQQGIADVCMGLGMIEEADNKPQRSLEYKRRAFTVFAAMGDEIGMADALTGLGRSYLLLQKTFPQYGDSAENVILRGLALAERFEARIPMLRATEDLYRLYKERKNPSEALRWYERFTALRDSVFNTAQATRLSEMQANFDSERAMQQRTLERWQRNMLLVSLVLVLMVFGVVINRFWLKNRSEALLRLKQDALEFEHLRAETLLSNILPQAIADRLKMGEKTIADAHQDATILFADIVGFTELTSRLSARELVRVLDHVFSGFDDIAAHYQCEKIKTIGDQYMVVAGVPHQSAHHAALIAEIALAMLDYMESLPTKHPAMPMLTIRIGIHTGDVVAGVIGQKKFAYDLWGDTVNTASRMESHGVPQKIHCSEAVYEALKESFVFAERAAVEIKGKGTMQTYFLMGKRSL